MDPCFDWSLDLVLDGSSTNIEDVHRFQDDKRAISSHPRYQPRLRMNSPFFLGEFPVIRAAGSNTCNPCHQLILLKLSFTWREKTVLNAICSFVLKELKSSPIHFKRNVF